MLVDSHCHLDFPELADDFTAVLARARAAGVATLQTICTRLSDFERVRALAERDRDLWCSVGVHPHHAGEEPLADAATLIGRARHPKVIGIGETGLDFHYERSPRDVQERSFRNHIAAAREAGLPVIVHSRSADDDTVRILEDEMAQGAFTGLIHCFSTGRALAERALALGLSISLAGIVTFKNAGDLRRSAALIPLSRLLIETDAPYLAPVPKRGRVNEPAYLAFTAACVAEIKGIPVAELARASSENFFRLFTKARPPEAALDPAGGEGR